MSLRVLMVVLSLTTLIHLTVIAEGVAGLKNEMYYGRLIGSLPDPQNIGLEGDVYVVNDTCIQIIRFHRNNTETTPDLHFWGSSSEERLSSEGGVLIPTFDYGNHPIQTFFSERQLILVIPNPYTVKSFRTFGLFNQAFAINFGYVTIPSSLLVPKPEFLDGTIHGQRYEIQSGPLLIMDRRRVKIYGFRFRRALHAPEAFFYVGKGETPKSDNGVKVPIRGGQTNPTVEGSGVAPIRKNYRGRDDLILDLPAGHEVYYIDWISVYCFKFKVDFGHIRIGNISENVPPYIPLMSKATSNSRQADRSWPELQLFGTLNEPNLTFHLGPSGGSKGFMTMAGVKPSKYVWYVNGLMAPKIWLQRGINVDGEPGMVEGNDVFIGTNNLYISNDSIGGFDNLPADEQKRIKIYAGYGSANDYSTKRPRLTSSNLTEENEAGKEGDGNSDNIKESQIRQRLCIWTSDENPETFQNFLDYRQSMQLTCSIGKSRVFYWTPDASTSSLLYYQSSEWVHMGWKIQVVDRLPRNIARNQILPYDQFNLLNSSDSQQLASLRLYPTTSSAANFSSLLPYYSFIANIIAYIIQILMV